MTSLEAHSALVETQQALVELGRQTAVQEIKKQEASLIRDLQVLEYKNFKATFQLNTWILRTLQEETFPSSEVRLLLGHLKTVGSVVDQKCEQISKLNRTLESTQEDYESLTREAAGLSRQLDSAEAALQTLNRKNVAIEASRVRACRRLEYMTWAVNSVIILSSFATLYIWNPWTYSP